MSGLVGLLIFIACATSFAIPLTLGGGPGSATFEVAIYQAIHSDADFARAAVLALLQIGAMVVLVALAAPLLVSTPEAAAVGRRIERADGQGRALRLIDGAVLVIALLLIVPPLLAVVWAALALWRTLTMNPYNFSLLLILGVFQVVVVGRILLQPKAGIGS